MDDTGANVDTDPDTNTYPGSHSKFHIHTGARTRCSGDAEPGVGSTDLTWGSIAGLE